MKIVTTTPTGHVGSHVVRLLVQAGERPTVLLRDPSRLDPELLALIDAVEGDQTDVDFVVRATEGADALFWVAPPTEADDPLDGYAVLAENVARAVTENRIARTVLQSSGGAEKRHGAGEIDGLATAEAALDGTGHSVLHLRCGYFFTNLLLDLDSLKAGVIRTVMPLDATLPWVDPRDIAEVAVARLLSTAWSGRNVQAVHGPEDLTFARVADILTDAVGRPIRAEHIDDGELRHGLLAGGMTDAQADAIVGMSTGLRGFTPEDPRSIRTTTPTALGGWAFENIRPLL